MTEPRPEPSRDTQAYASEIMSALEKLATRVDALERSRQQLLEETEHSATSISGLSETVKYVIVGCGAICFAVANFTGAISQDDAPFSFAYAFFSTASIASGLAAVMIGVMIRVNFGNIERKLKLLKIQFAGGDRPGAEETKAEIDKGLKALSFRLPQMLVVPATLSAIFAAFAFGEVVFR